MGAQGKRGLVMTSDQDAGQERRRAFAGAQPRSWLSIPRELLYVDFLGSLVPGLFTVILGTVMIVLTVSTISGIMFHSDGKEVFGLADYQNFVDKAHYELGVVMLVSAYIIGLAFFRQDPRRPDALSALQIWLASSNRDRRGLAVQKRDWSKVDHDDDAREPEDVLYHRGGFWRAYLYLWWNERLEDFDTQFPYRYMRCYLAARGLTHLVTDIPWCPKVEGTTGNRTKMLINILKIRLSALAPEFGRDTIRNEAHVRLATSVWYAATTLSRLSLASLLILGGVVAVAFLLHISFHGMSLFNAVAFLIFVITLCWLMKHQLRKCIHYMRVREVVYVLEAAYLAGRTYPLEFGIEDLLTAEGLEPCKSCDRLKNAPHKAHPGKRRNHMATQGVAAD